MDSLFRGPDKTLDPGFRTMFRLGLLNLGSDEELAIVDANRITIHGTRRGSGDDVPIEGLSPMRLCRSRFGSWEQAMGWSFRLMKWFWVPHFIFVSRAFVHRNNDEKTSYRL